MSAPVAGPPSPETAGPRTVARLDPRAGTILDGRYTFERFVVGTGNRLAYAAAKSVAENPGRGYCPLLVHCASGLGKTHLLAAIGRQTLLDDPARVVVYVSAESLVESLREIRRCGAREGSGAGLQGLDVLLVDDIQRAAGDPETAKELHEAIAALEPGRKQVVLASDRPPEEIPGLDGRLLARIRAGLVVDIQRPDAETRAAILRRKVREQGAELLPDAVNELALHEFASVRELEGALGELQLLRGAQPGSLTSPSLTPRPLAPPLVAEPAVLGGGVDPFFADPAKVFLHWEPLADRLAERLVGGEAPAGRLEPARSAP